ncbi:MAG: hypothetical protein A3K19_11095 [Lentisphaerae bacterium RIFOXYB12_FULL_65_16]|nr:MAG: hypothetical protein A3K18_32400 [Lentisphaerae bacterium RIFOXYA12_64_32]OGV90779.1 MAG: hypothetical protein A3K19_11095 [Lentisphaerae bacterium RIFOXYB12_FULL_65_16]
MNTRTLILRSLRYYWRTHLGVVAGTAVSTGILVGALLVGDSVRHTLAAQFEARLGRTAFALMAGDRFFRSDLAADLARRLQTAAAPVLALPCIAVAGDGHARVNTAQVLGVDARFWAMASDDASRQGQVQVTSASREPANPDRVNAGLRTGGREAAGLAVPPSGGPAGDALPHGPGGPALGPDEAFLNEPLAARLGAKVGDEVILRIEKPGLLPRAGPQAAMGRPALGFRLTVKGIVPDRQLGVFSLKPSQAMPCNLFVSRDWLAAELALPDRANLVVLAQRPAAAPAPAELDAALADVLQLADAGLRLRPIPATGGLALESERFFLDPAVAESAMLPGVPAQPTLTSLVNDIRTWDDRATPYSFVSAPGAPLVPDDMGDDEIILTQWLADDLSARPQDNLNLSYFVWDAATGLREASAILRVRAVVPLTGAAADPDLTPALPGLTDADSCQDWKPGLPIDLKRIRPKDEEYWQQHHGTPKAFVTLATAQRLWANRYGRLTSIRYQVAPDQEERLTRELRARLKPTTLGFVFRPVREEGRKAVAGAVDIGQLLLGLSFFLVAAALTLAALLFVFSVESRAAQIGTLLALGFRQRQVRNLFLGEGLGLAALGSLAGVVLGVAYAWLMLGVLSGAWSGAVGGVAVAAHLGGVPVATGVLAGLVAAVAALSLAIRHTVRKPVGELQRLGDVADSRTRTGAWTIAWAAVAVCAPLAAFAIAVHGHAGRGTEVAGTFFGAGALLLLGGLAVFRLLLHWLATGGSRNVLSLADLALRNGARRQGRSLATAGILACGVFLLVAVAANRHDPTREAQTPHCGTGGYLLYGETALPLRPDVDTPEGRRASGLDAERFKPASLTALRVRDGDDASCLNLNHVARPRLIGVRPEEFAARAAFAFARLPRDADPVDPWERLMPAAAGDAIPAVADDTVITWGLGLKLGDTLTYTGDHGETVRVRLVAALANSIFQGSILIPESAMLQHFADSSAVRLLLVDGPVEDATPLCAALTEALQDAGLDIQPAAARLAEFSRVENTYLSMFLALGGLGLVLGTLALGIVVLRNVLERRGELALMRAVGFRRGRLVALVLTEHLLLLSAGLVLGSVAAWIAVLPALASPAGAVPLVAVGTLLGAIFAGGCLCAWLATVAALRGTALAALREE